MYLQSLQRIFHRSTPIYHLLPKSFSIEEAGDKYTPVNTRQSPTRSILTITLVLWNILILGLGAYGLYLYSVSDRPVPPKAVLCYCGESIAEAKALGCKYDSLSVSWLPPHCRDDELVAEFDRSGPGANGEWPYWADINATRAIPLEEIGLLAGLPRGKAIFYSSNGWHVAHCGFSWRKEFRMRAKGLMMEKRYDTESHIEHCYSWFMKEVTLAEVSTFAVVALGGNGF